VRCR